MLDVVSKVKIFEKELTFVKNVRIRQFAEAVIGTLPDYFFEIPASSTGKYHPKYALGTGGLVRHSIAATRIAVELFRTDLWFFTDDEKDLILTALMVHDGYKSGKIQGKYTVTEHPLVAVAAVEQNKSLTQFLSEGELEFFSSIVRTHMGKWVFSALTKEKVLDLPESVEQKFVHLCDYIASRKCLEFDFSAEITVD